MNENCQKNFEKISEYLDGELGPEECRQIERHLDDCPECRNCLQALRKTIELCRRSAQNEVPQEMRMRLRSKLKECFNDHSKP